MLWQVPARASGSRSLANPGSMPLTKRLDCPVFGGFLDRRDELVGEHLPRVLEEHRAAADDVDSGGQDAPVVLERIGQPVVGHRGVDRAFGLVGQDRVEVGGGRDARRNIKARKLSGVLARLGFARHPDAGELVGRVGDELRQRVAADVAGADRGDFDGYGDLLTDPGWAGRGSGR